MTLLRRAGSAVDELARALGLTDNGVRAHLATLKRDGIVRQRGTVSLGGGGGEKPAYVYELAPEAEALFPKAYSPVLRELLDVMAERLGPEETEALLRTVGRRIAGERIVPASGLRAAGGGGRRRPPRCSTSWVASWNSKSATVPSSSAATVVR